MIAWNGFEFKFCLVDVFVGEGVKQTAGIIHITEIVPSSR